MKRITVLLMAGAIALALTMTAAAQYDTQQSPQADPATDMTRTVMGTVVSVSTNSLVIKTESGDQMIFTRDASSVIPDVVSAGSTVHVRYEAPQPGVFHVSNVVMNAGASDVTSQRSAAASTTPATEGTTSAAPTTGRSGEQTATDSEAMPKTASPFPMIGLLGLMALGGAVTIHSLNRR